MDGQRISLHIARFNAAVRSGDWAGFVATFSDDAVLSFVGAPAGAFRGREDIAAAYQSHPPDDTLTARQIITEGDVDIVRFHWDAGGGGTIQVRWHGQAITHLTVSFDG
jgi:ketosteroid isomerase-like protein